MDWAALNSDVQRTIGLYVSYDELGNLCLTEKRLNENIANSEEYWYRRYMDGYGDDGMVEAPSWKERYRRRRLLLNRLWCIMEDGNIETEYYAKSVTTFNGRGGLNMVLINLDDTLTVVVDNLHDTRSYLFDTRSYRLDTKVKRVFNIMETLYVIDTDGMLLKSTDARTFQIVFPYPIQYIHETVLGKVVVDAEHNLYYMNRYGTQTINRYDDAMVDNVESPMYVAEDGTLCTAKAWPLDGTEAMTVRVNEDTVLGIDTMNRVWEYDKKTGVQRRIPIFGRKIYIGHYGRCIIDLDYRLWRSQRVGETFEMVPGYRVTDISNDGSCIIGDIEIESSWDDIEI